MSALDKSIIALCDRHNLASISVSAIRFPRGIGFIANVQWLDGGEEHGRGIASAEGDTFVEALDGAVTGMLAKRGGNVDLPTDGLEVSA